MDSGNGSGNENEDVNTWKSKWEMEYGNANGNEVTEIWKWEREPKRGNGNEQSVVMMGMEKRNIGAFQKRL